MTSTNDDPAVQSFVSHAKKCEAFAAANPKAYRWRVAGLAILGYVFPPGVLLTLVALFVAVVWFYWSGDFWGGGFFIGKVGMALLVMIAMVARAMWPDFSNPMGPQVHRTYAPELFSFIDELRGKAGNPKVDRLYVTDEMNAAVIQRPRLGLFGWYRNDLILGLPLMQALSRRELAAVIAHEFGHLSGAHGKLGAWVYRTRLLMSRIMSDIEEKPYFGSWVFRWFYRWYAPYFSAYSFALAREQEYEADRMAASAASPQAAVDALVRVSIAADYMHRVFWSDLWGAAAGSPGAPERVYDRFGKKMAALSNWAGATGSFNAILANTTDYADTHPSLTDRARALGVEPEFSSGPEAKAITMLPNEGEKLIAAYSEEWQLLAEEHWKERHRELQDQKRQLLELDAAAQRGELGEDDAMTRGLLAEIFMEPEAALARYDQALSWSERVDGALFAKGRVLLNMGRDDGLACLDQVMDRDEDAISPGCDIAEAYLWEAGRAAESQAYERRREAHEEMLAADWADRTGVHPDDTFVPHGYSAEEVDSIFAAIKPFEDKSLKRAWLVRKPTRYRRLQPAYFLICDFGFFKRWTGNLEKMEAELCHPLEDRGDLVVLVCDVEDGWLRDKAGSVPNAQIFPRPRVS